MRKRDGRPTLAEQPANAVINLAAKRHPRSVGEVAEPNSQ